MLLAPRDVRSRCNTPITGIVTAEGNARWKAMATPYCRIVLPPSMLISCPVM